VKTFVYCITTCLSIVLTGAPVTLAKDSIVVLKSREIQAYEIALKSFRNTLREKGDDPAIGEYLLPEGNQEREGLLADIRRQKPRLIVALGSAATSHVSKAVRDLPVVFCMVLNPVASGFIRSMNASGNNLTGASLDIPAHVQFEALRSIVPHVRRVGVIYNPQETESVVQQAKAAAKGIGLDLVSIAIPSKEKVPDALETLDRSIDALWSVADSTLFSSGSTEFILLHTLRNKIPFMGLSPAFVKAGALMALAADYEEVGVQCGGQAKKVLMGDQPSTIPVTRPQRVTLHVNLKTADIIGLTISPNRLKGAVVLQ
jgi:putative tryptophan/tyrosine transport system substrate-binding protein